MNMIVAHLLYIRWVVIGWLELKLVEQFFYRPKLKGVCSEAHIFVSGTILKIFNYRKFEQIRTSGI